MFCGWGFRVASSASARRSTAWQSTRIREHQQRAFPPCSPCPWLQPMPTVPTAPTGWCTWIMASYVSRCLLAKAGSFQKKVEQLAAKVDANVPRKELFFSHENVFSSKNRGSLQELKDVPGLPRLAKRVYAEVCGPNPSRANRLTPHWCLSGQPWEGKISPITPIRQISCKCRANQSMVFSVQMPSHVFFFMFLLERSFIIMASPWVEQCRQCGFWKVWSKQRPCQSLSKASASYRTSISSSNTNTGISEKECKWKKYENLWNVWISWNKFTEKPWNKGSLQRNKCKKWICFTSFSLAEASAMTLCPPCWIKCALEALEKSPKSLKKK